MAPRWICVTHLFYGHLHAELLNIGNRYAPDLIVTVPAGADPIPSNIPGRVVQVPNIGQDIGSFLIVLRDYLLNSDYEYVLKIHSKRRNRWRRSLIRAAIAGKRTIELDTNIGMVGSLKHLANGMGKNKRLVKRYHRELFGAIRRGDSFIAGTIFACRLEPLRRYLTVDKINLIYSEMKEGYKRDGTAAHAMERVICHIIAAAGYRVRGI